jgi:hypothetical protein
MIDSAVAAITDRLNQYLRNEFDLSEDVVTISNILEQNGTLVSHIDNKIAVFLVNIEKETAAKHYEARSLADARNPTRHPPLHLNLYLMFAACFGGKNYPESLKFISNTIAFFQRNPIFDHQNTPELDRRIDRLILDMENIPLKDLNSVWSVLSGKYLPSVLYKVRLLTFAGQDIRAAVPVVRDTEQSVQGG